VGCRRRGGVRLDRGRHDAADGFSRTALLAAFADRFAIGLVIGCVQLPGPGWAVGLGFGLLLSLPSAIVTKAYVPILVIGGLGGLVIGGLLHGWGSAA